MPRETVEEKLAKLKEGIQNTNAILQDSVNNKAEFSTKDLSWRVLQLLTMVFGSVVTLSGIIIEVMDDRESEIEYADDHEEEPEEEEGKKKIKVKKNDKEDDEDWDADGKPRLDLDDEDDLDDEG